MPSLFEGLGKMFRGEPLFTQPKQPTPTNTQPIQRQTGPKAIPRLEITDCDCSEGPIMQCVVTFHNQSQTYLDLDKLTFLGTTKDLGTKLAPGESRRVQVYEGPALQNGNQSSCRLTYVDATGDYFQLNYYTQFTKNADGTFIVGRLIPMQNQDI